MAWVPENIRTLRRLVESGAPAERVTATVDDHNGKLLVLDGEYGLRDLDATEDELEAIIEVLDENPRYRLSGIRTRAACSLVLSTTGRHDEAARLVTAPLEELLISISEAADPEKPRLHPEVALLRLTQARIAEKQGNLMKFVLFLKLACDSARRAPQSPLSMLAFNQFRAAFDKFGESEAANAIAEEIGRIGYLPTDWVANDWLWQL